MSESYKLNPNQLKKECDLSIFNFKTTEEIQPIEYLIGQERALSSINFALDIKVDGYNLYVSGPSGSGRTSAIRKIVSEKAKDEKTPDDLCYVYNFKDPDRPNLIKFPAGRGNSFAKDMEDFISTIRKTIPKAFETEDYERRRNEIVKRFQLEKENIIQDIENIAKEKGFLIQLTPTGVLTIPLKDGVPIKPEEFQKLTPEEQKRIQEEGQKLLEELNEVVLKIKKIDKKIIENLNELDIEIAVFAIGHLLKDLKEKYSDIPEVSDYLDELKEDIINNLNFFKSPKENGEEFLRRYKINVIVDNSKTKGAPVIFETNPTYFNLFGGIEYETKMGVMYTDFNLIKSGSIHKANGGYIIINALDLLLNQFSWDALKRTLKNKESIIENPLEQLKIVPTVSIKPEPIPIDVKVILIGTPYIYYLLYYYDEDFKKLFRVKADFDTEMDRNEENMNKYVNFISSYVRKENFKHLTKDAVKEVIEYGSRIVEDQDKITTRFQLIGDLITEANYWAQKENSNFIEAKHIIKAIDEKYYRSNLIEKKIHELIKDGTLLIDVDGEKIGQINGLAIISIGDFEFAKPTKITADVSMGGKGIINIEREVKLSGRIHDKGVMILSGFIGERYAKDKPLSLNATLTFEQSYEEVEGDSASSAELYALISSIGKIPIKQYLAVTGSVNQKGEIQPIGGVNRKIEGFFDTCKIKGFNGKQGVIIPKSNVKNLMLKKEVIDAVKEGKFHIYTVSNIEEGLEILTGMTIQEIDKKVNEELYKLAISYKKFGEEKKVEIETKSSSETIELGKKLSSCLQIGDLILIKGELGAGKSTFIKGIGKGIGVTEEIKSPSFIIVNELKGKKLTLYHIDLYRIDGIEIFELGLNEFLNRGIVVIEWADKVEDFFENFDLIEINIEILNLNKRKINITFKGEDIIKKMLQISLNTAIEPYGVSLLEDEKLLSSYLWSYSDTGKNEHIIGIDFILKSSNKKLTDLDFLTILSGPGSFTGLRIGFTFVKTINYIFKTPIVTVDAFEVLKEEIKIENFLIVINAGLKEFFIFDGENIKIIKQNELIKISNKKILIFPEYYLFNEFGNGINLKIDTYILGKIGFKKFKKGKIEDYKTLTPLYLRDTESIFKKYK